ncbi:MULTISPECIES: ABC transporter ATP-binding protein [Sutterellaceae]|uniref:ABC transporter ATP-binding protein n=1 Tax=Sutterellaceae TaxID=995019 RepID=UPI00203BD9E4|nr:MULTISPECIES: ABC transporter ATP-binding protein [Sutterellaceae]
MAYINLKDVTVDIPIFNSQGRSLKKKVLGIATGGRIGLTESGKTIVRSLSNINLEIKTQVRLGIIGHNGAGKSTLLRVLSGVYQPTFGSATIVGKIGSLIGISLGIDPEATGVENIYIRAALLGIPKETVDHELDGIVKFSGLGDFIEMPVRTYSTGMHLRLAFAVSTMITPDILLMDEWLSVGDESFKNQAEQRLNGLIERANILVIASHSRSLIERCCNKVLWLERGEVKMIGDPKEICSLYFSKK